jgi:hypothetical protein
MAQPQSSSVLCAFDNGEAFHDFVKGFYAAYDPDRAAHEAYSVYSRLAEASPLRELPTADTMATTAAAPSASLQLRLLDELYALCPEALSNLITTALVRYAPQRLGGGEEAAMIRRLGTFSKVAPELMSQFDVAFGTFLPNDAAARLSIRCREEWSSYFNETDVYGAHSVPDEIATRINRAGGTILDEETTFRRFADECFKDADASQRKRSALWRAVFACDASGTTTVDRRIAAAAGDAAAALRQFREEQHANSERRLLEVHFQMRLGLSAADAEVTARRALLTRAPGSDLSQALSYEAHLTSPLDSSPPPPQSQRRVLLGAAARNPWDSALGDVSAIHDAASPAGGSGRRTSPLPPAMLMMDSATRHHDSLVNEYQRLRAATNPYHHTAAAAGPVTRISTASTSAHHSQRILSPSAPFSSGLEGVVNAATDGQCNTDVAVADALEDFGDSETSWSQPRGVGTATQPQHLPQPTCQPFQQQQRQLNFASEGRPQNQQQQQPLSAVARMLRTFGDAGDTPRNVRFASEPTQESSGTRRDTTDGVESSQPAAATGIGGADLEQWQELFESERRRHMGTARELDDREAELVELRRVLERGAEALNAQQAALEAREREQRALQHSVETRQRDLAAQQAVLEAAASKAPQEVQKLRRVYAELQAREAELEELQRDCEASAAALSRREETVGRREYDAQVQQERRAQGLEAEARGLQESYKRREEALEAERQALETERERWAIEQEEAIEARADQAARLRAADEAVRRREAEAARREEAVQRRERDAERREQDAAKALERAQALHDEAMQKLKIAAEAAAALDVQARAVDQLAVRLKERESALWRAHAWTVTASSSRLSNNDAPPPISSLEQSLDVASAKLSRLAAS